MKLKIVKSKWLLLTLVLTLAIPVFAFAQTGETVADQDNKPAYHGKKFKKHHHFKKHMLIGAHKEMYFQLLAEKYTPNQLEEWNSVIEERQELVAKLKELKMNSQLKSSLKDKKKHVKNEHKEKIKQLREKVKNGELTKEEAKQQIKEKMKSKLHDKVAGEHHNTMIKFTEAIKEKDEENIKIMLPQILEMFKMKNEHLKQLITTLTAE
jgi:hypothetical protein